MNIRAFFQESRVPVRHARIVLGRLQAYEAGGHVPQIHASALVHESAVLIGNVCIGADCYIGPNAVCRGDQGSIVIEKATSVQDNCILHTGPGGRVVVGELGQIGHGAMLHGCTIGRNVLVGMGSILLDDALIEDEALVAAGTLVLTGQRVPPRMLIRGNPGKVVRRVTDQELSEKAQICQNYVAIARLGIGIRRVIPRIVGSSNETHADRIARPTRQTPDEGRASESVPLA